MNQDIFTGKMFRSLFVPSLWASVGLAFSDMADALVVGWRMGETGLAARYGVNGIPHYVVISPAGQIVKVQTGYGKGLFPRLWDEVKRKEK